MVRQADPAAVTLPADLLAAIEGASVLVRLGHDENGPRIFVSFAGVRTLSWRYSDEDTAVTLKKAYPELNERQIARAVRAVAGVVALKLREPSPYLPPPRRNWATNW